MTTDDGVVGDHRAAGTDFQPAESVGGEYTSKMNLRTSAQDLADLHRGHHKQTATVHRSKEANRRSNSFNKLNDGPSERRGDNAHEDSQTLEANHHELGNQRGATQAQQVPSAVEAQDQKYSTNTLSFLPQMLPEQIHAGHGQAFGPPPGNAPQPAPEVVLPAAASTDPMQSRQMTQSQYYLSSQQ